MKQLKVKSKQVNLKHPYFVNKKSNVANTVVVLLLLFSTGLSLALQTTSPLLIEARQNMPNAFKDEKSCTELYNKLKNVKNPEPLLKGYIGGVYIARSRHAPLVDKPSALRKGTALLEEAIKEKPNTTELLFLRLTIQLNLPSFLGYNDNVEEDKKFVLDNYHYAPPVLKERIINFIKNSEHFTEEEKLKVTN